jgi:Leucine-rich repeat (LRR) protein
MEITSLVGLEHFKSLESLDLSHNRIRDLTPLAGLTELATLALRFNRIENLTAIGAILSLQSLDLRANRIFELPILDLPNLSHLDLARNNLTNTDGIALLAFLESLTLSNNQITDVQALSALTSLQSLDLDGNIVHDISPLFGQTQLVFLNLLRNQVNDLEPLRSLTALNRLCMAFNQIRDIRPLSTLTNLDWLDISCNDIVDISALSSATRLTVLLAGANRIADIVPLEPLALEELSLGDNALTSLSPALSGVLGPDALLVIAGNPLSITATEETIPALQSAGIEVEVNRSTIVSFADNALESVVREAIARPLGFIFLDAIGDLTALHAAAGITDISGIEHLHNLQTSTCRAMRSSILHHSRTFTD